MEDRTQLRFKITFNEAITELLPLSVVTRYSGYVQEYTVVLQRTGETERPFLPIGKHSILQPEGGMSFLIKMPTGFPQMMPFQPWAACFNTFLNKIDSYFIGPDFKYVREDWRKFHKNTLPKDVNGVSTDDFNAYLAAGIEMDLPLSKYVYCDNKSFRDYIPLTSVTSALTSGSGATLLSGFESSHILNASTLDIDLMKTYHQIHASVEWRGMPRILRDWKLDHKYILHGVTIKRGSGDDISMRDGIIMAYCSPDYNKINGMFRIKFLDGSAEYELPESKYGSVRDEYLKTHENSVDDIDLCRRTITAKRLDKAKKEEEKKARKAAHGLHVAAVNDVDVNINAPTVLGNDYIHMIF